MQTRRLFIGGTAAAIAAQFVSPARAQPAWPSKPLRFVVPFAPGGSSEIIARAAAGELSKTIGQNVFVDNKPGASGNIAMAEVARADDQHTIILGHIGTLAVNPYIYKRLPYDPAKDFKPVSLLAKVPSLYVVNPNVPVHNLKDLIALASAGAWPAAAGAGGCGATRLRAGGGCTHARARGVPGTARALSLRARVPAGALLRTHREVRTHQRGGERDE
ncbi:MAG TPA: tripartite tricarboxylate transporter substrate-binding protein, partial [Ramlibacter sp.]|nr:tripartite tricarboxylate transporter substrate-binding protein [Ramlibacter sp.]